MISVESKKKLLSNLDTIILPTSSLQDSARVSWKKDLGIRFSDAQWYKIKCFNQKNSGNVSIQENRSMLVNCWYLIPRRLVKM